VIVRFAFAEAAWELAEARHAVATVAALIGAPWRLAPAGADAVPGEAMVFVGPAEAAPAEACAVIAVEGWPRWNAEDLAAAEFEGEPLPCPRATPWPAADPRVLPPAWLRSIGHALAREEEFEDSARDQWGCFSGFQSRLHRLGMLERAFVNRLARGLARRVAERARSAGVTLEPLPLWKGGAPFAAALTHDVDDVTLHSWAASWRLLRQARAPGDYALRAGLAGLARAARHAFDEGDPYWTLDLWMSEEESRGFRSTFYFLPPAPSRRHPYDGLYRMDDRIGYRGRRVPVREVMRAMIGRGHEIGLHGSYRSHRDGGEMARQRAQIGEACGREPRGIRQHFLRFDVAATWRAQSAAGFEYDTTLGYNETPGFRAGIAAPFRPYDAAARAPGGPLELPLTAMDGALFRSLGLDLEGAAGRMAAHLAEVEEVGGLAVLLWHPNAASERHFPGWWPCYVRVLDRLRARGAWVAPASEIAEWWADRLRRGDRTGRALVC
jgi:peptidoglycan/xylan/chitin deacetylase (PgdA/CDA1 family)